MPFHLPALLAKAKAFLSTPKGRKTALIGAGAGGAVVLGLRAKKKGLDTIEADPLGELDPASPGGGGSFGDLFPPDAGVVAPGGGQTTTPGAPASSPGDSFSGGFSNGSAPFVSEVPLDSSAATMGLSGSTASGPGVLTLSDAAGGGALAGMYAGFGTLPPSVQKIAASSGALGLAIGGAGKPTVPTGGWGQPLGPPSPSLLGRIVTAPAPSASDAALGRWLAGIRAADAAAAGARAGAGLAPATPSSSDADLGRWLAGIRAADAAAAGARAGAGAPPPLPKAPIAGWGAGTPTSAGYGGVKPAPPPAAPVKKLVSFF